MGAASASAVVALANGMMSSGSTGISPEGTGGGGDRFEHAIAVAKAKATARVRTRVWVIGIRTFVVTTSSISSLHHSSGQQVTT